MVMSLERFWILPTCRKPFEEKSDNVRNGRMMCKNQEACGISFSNQKTNLQRGKRATDFLEFARQSDVKSPALIWGIFIDPQMSIVPKWFFNKRRFLRTLRETGVNELIITTFIVFPTLKLMMFVVTC